VETFKKEFLILSSIRSHHIVNFYGACLEPQLAMVMELCAKHSLFDVMNDRKERLNWEIYFQMSIHTIKGIQCLHHWKPQIVHRDLKSANLVVTNSYDVLLTDFGLSRFVTPSNIHSLQRVCGTVCYCPPEVFSSNITYGTNSDIYSMSICFWELTNRILSGHYQRPFYEFSQIRDEFELLEKIHEDSFRPSFHEKTPQGICQLIKSCWISIPEKRPEINTVLKNMLDLEAEYKAAKVDWDSKLA